jgi:serine/threonine protein kinase
VTEEPFEMGVLALSGELRQLGPYRLLGQLATGGMGVIYLGRHPASGQLVALKTLLAPGGVTAEARKRFDREVRLARRITSSHTARVLDADAEAPRPWMAMEYVPAPSLQALVVQRGALGNEAAVRWIASGVVQALAELHGKGIVHRDVKPLNTLLTQDGPKVIDFGISHASDLTSTKFTLGTVAFAAPEQAEGQPSAPASDVYALGVTLYYVACGRLPYPETDEALRQLNYVRQAAVTLDGLPDGLTGVIGECLAVRPEDRPTAEQLVHRFAGGDSSAVPGGWASLIDRYAAEGRRLQRAADQSEAETVTRSWTVGPGGTRLATLAEDPEQTPGPAAATPPPPGPPRAAEQAEAPQPATPSGAPGATGPASGTPSSSGTAPGSVPPASTEAANQEPRRRTRWKSEYLYALVGAAVLIVSLVLNFHGDHSDDPSDSSTTGTSSPATDTATESSTGDDSPGDQSSATAPSPEDEAFAAIRIDDCLDSYTDPDGMWSSDTPQAASCSGTGSYYRVISIAHDTDGCSDTYDNDWSHTNGDGTTTDLCLNRNFRAGQCEFADKEEKLYRTMITPCDGDIPVDYKYVVKITGVHSGDYDCGDSDSWTLDDAGVTLCGTEIRQSH